MTVGVFVDLDEEYTNSKVKTAIKNSDNFHLTTKEDAVLVWEEYETIEWDKITKIHANSYPIRKALIRKAQNASIIRQYVTKHPSSALSRGFPETYAFELEHPDYLDEMMNEMYEVRDSLMNADAVWIMKPSMTNRGQGIFLIDSMDKLEEIMWAIEEADEDPGSEYHGLSDVREWVMQRYILNPLLLSCGRKFHLRAYVLAIGNLSCFLYEDMLALFAPVSFEAGNLDLESHITNTCAQMSRLDFNEEQSVKLLSDLKDPRLCGIFSQIKAILGNLFEAAHVQPAMFRPMRNCFELYGMDFLVDDTGNVFFLEANAFPDFKQTGDRLGSVIEALFKQTVNMLAVNMFKTTSKKESDKFHLVYEKIVTAL